MPLTATAVCARYNPAPSELTECLTSPSKLLWPCNQENNQEGAGGAAWPLPRGDHPPHLTLP